MSRVSDFLSTPRKIAAGMLYQRLKREAVTVEALDEALLPVFRMLVERGVIGAPPASPFVEPEAVPCPRCGVDAFRPCRDPQGHVLDVPHWQRARKWEHSLDSREARLEELSRDLSRMVGLSALAAREAAR